MPAQGRGEQAGRSHAEDDGQRGEQQGEKPPEVEPEIVWAKFKSLAEGARLASHALWA